MRHKRRGRRLGRNSSHRKALGRNILISLFEHGQIITTLSKAKEYAPAAEKMISIAKKAEMKVALLQKTLEGKDVTSEMKQEVERQAEAIRLAAFRRALVKLPNKATIQKLFYDIAPLFEKRAGGYTSVLHLGKNRLGDNAPRAVLRLVEKLPDAEAVEKTHEQKKAEKAKQKEAKQDVKRKRKERKEREKEKARLKKEKEKARLKKEREKKKNAKK